ncbi:RING finger protein nhl-1 [Patella vulgata]|uniref:RING finger protein nhl-1 n=1 Tax=Patella vulgata TaxID=6465 RepID=UPI00217F3ECA|nr:RING finger protein nhl-1 [Patella vulgata]XP_050416110.1 RING finger protein nhl-1 [Patella vulgata]XP_050416111.1 RING finger protein nhl-1 [Patella vulgata]
MMNSPKDFEEDFLSCLICFGKFNHPKTLPCLHTFCLECLRSYIKTTTHYQNGTSFKCPTCRDLAAVPHPQSPDWASQFKTNFYVNNLMEAAAATKTAPQNTLVSSADSTLLSNKIAIKKKSEIAAHQSQIKPYLLSLDLVCIELGKELTSMKSEKERIKNVILAQSKQLLLMVQKETTKCLGRLESISFEIDGTLQSRIDSTQRLRSSVESTCSDMDTLINGSDTKIVEDGERILGEKQRLMSILPTSLEIPVFKIKYNPGAINIGDVIGTPDYKTENRVLPLDDARGVPKPSPYFNPNNKLTYFSKLETKVKGDKHNPSIRDIALLQIQSGTMVVTDSGNNCIKSFYNNKGAKKDNSRLSTGLPPHAVTVINAQNKIAVTIPKAKEIYVVNVTPNLALEKQIRTHKKYWGITSIDGGNFAVSTCPGSEAGVIDIINLTGEVLQNIHTAGLFPNPLYLTSLSTGDIIVSDCTVQKVAGLRQNGDVIFGKDKRFIRPMGVACDSFGGILIVDANQNVIVMNGQGVVQNKYALQCKDTKKEVIRSLAVHENIVYLVSEDSLAFTFLLQ